MREIGIKVSRLILLPDKECSMQILSVVVLMLLSLSVLASSRELQPVAANFSTRLTERGRDVMTLLRVPESCSWQNCSSWCFPTSIVVAGVSYRVESDVFREEYVVHPLNGNTPVARGHVTRWTTVNDARVGAFGEYAVSSCLPFVDIMNNLDAIAIGSQTNMIYLTPRYGLKRGILMCRNLNLDVHGPSNHVDFAVGVMNAGLKESERCAIEPRTVMRWNPTSAELGQWYFGRPRQPNTP